MNTTATATPSNETKYEVITGTLNGTQYYRVLPLTFLEIKGGAAWFVDENGDTVYFRNLLNAVFDSEQEAEAWIKDRKALLAAHDARRNTAAA